jgi:hypothetical protein
MKRKAEIRTQVVGMIAKGRFAVLTQYVYGGPITCDDNNGKGYSAEEASALSAKLLKGDSK